VADLEVELTEPQELRPAEEERLEGEEEEDELGDGEDDNEMDDDDLDDDDLDDDDDDDDAYDAGRVIREEMMLDESTVTSVPELLRYFQLNHLPQRVSSNDIIIFIRFYHPTADPALAYLGHGLYDPRLTSDQVRELLVRKYGNFMPSGNPRDYILFEEVTPMKVRKKNLWWWYWWWWRLWDY